MWYRDFTPVSDEQVLALLAEAAEDRADTPRGSRRDPLTGWGRSVALPLTLPLGESAALDAVCLTRAHSRMMRPTTTRCWS